MNLLQISPCLHWGGFSLEALFLFGKVLNKQIPRICLACGYDFSSAGTPKSFPIAAPVGSPEWPGRHAPSGGEAPQDSCGSDSPNIEAAAGKPPRPGSERRPRSASVQQEAPAALPACLPRRREKPDTSVPADTPWDWGCPGLKRQPGNAGALRASERLPSARERRPLASGSAMGNLCGCTGGAGNCPSPFKRKKEKPGTRINKSSTKQHPESNKGLDVGPVYDDVSDFPVYATVSKPKNMKRDDSSVHYADIQIFSKIRERSAEEVKSFPFQNATEYATLNFPRATLKYDSKNGTLV
ncbi:uncharacterized protein C11orf52 homolog [Rhineura floridana]|uniref:uncharacterized protein C11orf52 homolog n=1 Tax=Rhineura floridana TaxID=261503 RepID=UPI002AC84EE5|nr:uncharacterized protein C11orf52 homolog [Rhineura floridana]